MKKSTIVVPVSMTAALACVISLNMSCGKNNNPPVSPAETAKPAKAGGESAPARTNAAPAAPAAVAVISNPPLATTTVAAPATPEPAPTAPLEGTPHHTIVEMPLTTPKAPTNFYNGDFAKKSGHHPLVASRSAADDYFSLLFRAGYQHVNHGDNNDTWWLSVKLGVNGEELRERAGKNAWLVPDAYAELTHQYLPKPDDSKHPGSGEGIQFRAGFFWPWLQWTSQMFARTNAVCPMCAPLAFKLGPTVNLGFDELFDDREARLARYAGARLTLNHDAFIEYTVGGTDGLAGTPRSQVVTELPFYLSRKNGVRYYFRGLWNTGFNHTTDELEAGVFVELPLTTLVSPSKWHSLIPGCE